MLPLSVTSERDRIDTLVGTLDKSVDAVELLVQNVYANHLVLAAAGYVERSTIQILAEYGRRNGNPSVARYIEKTAERNNSLNCEKIQKILSHFDPSWWSTLEGQTPAQSISSVDSIKALRDQIAHGRPNGTGYRTIRDYYGGCKRFVRGLGDVVLP